MAKNRKCLSCATSYSYCPDCSRADKLAPAWKAQFCSESCMTLWTTATKYNMKMLTKSEAEEIILNLDLKLTDEYVSCIQRDLKNIMAEEKKPKRGKMAELKIIDEVMDIEQVIAEPIVTEVVEPTVHEVIIKKENE